jgi:hypothetical protein
MQKLTITIALAVIALALGTTTTTMQIQPAYSQTEHCALTQAGSSNCATLGQDSSITTCNPFGGCNFNDDPSGRELGSSIGTGHHNCGQFPNSVTCTVTPP